MRNIFGAAVLSPAWLALIATTLAGCFWNPRVPTQSPAKTAQAAGLVDIRTLIADFQVEMRYAGSDNFMGMPVVGYENARCYLLRPAAEALARIERELREQNLRLKVFDCYRPVRAVRHFVAWAGDLNNQRTKARYYPNIEKRNLLGEYIAATSGHSRGAALDVTLTRCDASGNSCSPLDMGTEFDFFDALAHTAAAGISAEQRQNRLLLRTAMESGGFRNDPLEWWHYTLTPEPSQVAFDVPVE